MIVHLGRRVFSGAALILFSTVGVHFVDAVEQAIEIRDLPYAQHVIEQTGFNGNLLMYDMNSDVWLAADPDAVDQSYIPASTFKIMSSLVALETGVLAGIDTIMPWDGVVRGRTETNKAMDLREAFQISSVPHYQELVRQVGQERMQDALNNTAYGNRNLSGGIDQFWLSGELRISPRQQIELMRGLYHNKLPFSAAVMKDVKTIMVLEETEDYVLRAKTGLAVLNEDDYTGWWVGWVEHNDNVTFFATVLTAEAPGDAFIPARLGVTRDVLMELGVLPGD